VVLWQMYERSIVSRTGAHANDWVHVADAIAEKSSVL